MHQVGGIDVIEDVILMQLMMDGVVGIVDIGATDYPMAFLLELGENFQGRDVERWFKEFSKQAPFMLYNRRTCCLLIDLPEFLLCYETAVPV